MEKYEFKSATEMLYEASCIACSFIACDISCYDQELRNIGTLPYIMRALVYSVLRKHGYSYLFPTKKYEVGFS